MSEMNLYSILPRSPEVEPHLHMQFRVMPRTPFWGEMRQKWGYLQFSLSRAVSRILFANKGIFRYRAFHDKEHEDTPQLIIELLSFVPFKAEMYTLQMNLIRRYMANLVKNTSLLNLLKKCIVTEFIPEVHGNWIYNENELLLNLQVKFIVTEFDIEMHREWIYNRNAWQINFLKEYMSTKLTTEIIRN